jgi:exopolysaccharide biosynthesis polyprenyl glycosylphosphotransferase
MFQARAKLFRILQFTADLVLTGIAFFLAYFSRVYLLPALPWNLNRYLNPALYPIRSYLWIFVLATIVWAAIAFSLGLYRISIRRSSWKKIGIIISSAILMWFFVGFFAFVLKLDLSRPLVVGFVIYQTALLILARLFLIRQTRKWYATHTSRHSRNLVIIGADSRAREMGKLISRYSDWGYRILGYIEMEEKSSEPKEPDILGSVSDLHDIIEKNIVDEIIFMGSRPNLDCLDKVLEICKEQGIGMRVAADFFPAKVTKVSMEFLENVPVISFSSTPDHAFALFIKRVLDVVVSATLLIILMPFMVAVGLLVRLTSKGPIIYRQIRSGLYGRKFVLYKFRSMKDGAEDILWEIKHLNEMDGPVFKMRDDPRVTPLGRFLRRSSIDEWPQFWNVLKGDMSLVGPRAPLPDEVREYTRWQRRRLSVKPGITCIWQISGRNEIDFQEWMKLDLNYIDNWSLLLDLKILLRTIPVVIHGRGAQ